VVQATAEVAAQGAAAVEAAGQKLRQKIHGVVGLGGGVKVVPRTRSGSSAMQCRSSTNAPRAGRLPDRGRATENQQLSLGTADDA